jgi:general secretion pathway protein K
MFSLLNNSREDAWPPRNVEARRSLPGARCAAVALRGGMGGPHASSLLFVLWAIMLVSFAVIGLITHLSRGLDEALYAEKEFRARLLLQSARTLSTHPDIEWGDPLLRQRVSSTLSYEVVLTTEGVRLAINQLVNSAVQRQFAQRLFVKWGMDERDAQTLIDSIADWIDSDDRPRGHGGEREHYRALGNPHFPFNRPFDDLDDLLLVRGADELDYLRPDWRDQFTLYGDGTIDVHRSSPELLAALFDVTPSEIGRFISARLGADGLAETIDDPRFTSLAEVRALLDVPRANYAAVSALLTLNHPIKRTDCRAWAGQLERRLTVLSGPGLHLIHEE